jgi:hypothetical protein
MMAASSFTLIRRGHLPSSPQRERVDLKFFRSNCVRLIPREEPSAGLPNDRDLRVRVLIRDGLASAMSERVLAGKTPMAVTRLRITAAGRRTLDCQG